MIQGMLEPLTLTHHHEFRIYRSFVSVDQTYLICHVNLSDDVINSHINLRVGASHPPSYH